jgi:hypothetical protein
LLQYKLIGADLCDLPLLASLLATAALDPSLPTLVLSECVLTYVGVDHTNALIAYFAKAFPASLFMTYEQIIPHDGFGE